MLRTAAHLRVDLQLREPSPQLVEHDVEVAAAFGRLGEDELLDLGVAPRVEDREREVLELPLHITDTEPMREGA